ncbi:MAG: TorF family putative porin [Pseudomonadota bacterium]|nr:TorF family putative porin [Pseudomonadota bacterium]
MLNKQSKLLRLSALSLAVAGAMAVAPAANAEVSASVGVANMYLWRGYDLGNGDAQVSGDLSYSNSGFYTGVWAASGDSAAGQEYDLYMGYGAEFGGVSIDLSVWNYMYPSSPEGEDNILDDFGGVSDAVLSIGFAGFAVTAYDNIAGSSGSAYYTVSYGYDAFSLLLGKHDVRGPEEEDGEPTGSSMMHVDLSYAYNDNLSFTVSQQVDKETDDDPKVVVSYSLPIDM